MVRLCALVLMLGLGSSCGGGEPVGTTTAGEGADTTSGGTPTAPPDDPNATADADGDGWPDDDWADGDTPPAVEHHDGAMAQLTVSPPETPWATMSRGDREMYMIGKVMPIMNEVFARQYGTRVANFGCETCHGRDMREVAFAMPSRAAMPVPQPGTSAYARLERQFPESVRFMSEVVTPTMGTLLGIEGYTCNHCHPGGR